MLRACLLAIAVCTDTFFAAMGCSMSGIVIPKRCAAIVSLVGTAFLGISLLFAELLYQVLPPGFCRYGGSVLLCAMGGIQLCKGMLNTLLEQRGSMCLRCRGIGLVIRIYLDETTADADGSKRLSMGEAFAFAAALSLDSLASGIGAGIFRSAVPLCLVLTLLLGFSATIIGCKIGTSCKKESPLSWIGGGMLVLLGISRLF